MTGLSISYDNRELKKSNSTSKLDVSKRIIEYQRRRLDMEQTPRFKSIAPVSVSKLPVLGEKNVSNFGWPTMAHIQSFAA